TAYVAGVSSRRVIPINTATNTAGKPIKVGLGPDLIAFTPNGETAYVANYNSGTVTPINTATNVAGKPIKVGASPKFIATNGKTAYVSSASKVTPISTATNTPGKPIYVGPGARRAAATPDGTTPHHAPQRGPPLPPR